MCVCEYICILCICFLTITSRSVFGVDGVDDGGETTNERMNDSAHCK